MDIDENDLLFSNQYIPYPELEKEVSSQANEEFKKFYEKEKQLQEEKNIRENLDKISIKNFNLDEETDDKSLLNTNEFKLENLNNSNTTGNLIRRTKEVVTYVSVDSRDRNKTLFPKASFFKIFLGKTFYNVKSIRLASMEFPNTNAVINSNNNKIYWRNKEDIDNDKTNDITKLYPIYNTTLRTGSYVATTLETEMFNKLSLIKRQDGDSIDFHYFIVDLDLDTDIVTFTSLILSQLPVNPLSTLSGSGIITVNHPDHGLKTNDQIYLVGAQTVAGISSQYLNTIHTISVIDPNEYQIEVNIKAATSLQLAGGNTVKCGKIAPFQFLFGDYTNTVAQNIGFPLENSSQLIKTYIQSIETIYQVLVTTKQPHRFTNTFSHLGQNCTISGTGSPPDGIDGSRIITKIINQFNFLILVNNPLSIITLFNPIVTFDGSTFEIENISNYNFNTVLIKTFTNHNYDVSHIGSNVTLYETKTVPSLDDTHKIDGIFALNTFTIVDTILGESNTNIVGGGGYISRNHPITTYTVDITSITTGSTTILECHNHNLRPNDKIQINNVKSSPSINGIHTIYTTPNSNTITLNYQTNNITLSSDIENRSYIGTGLYTVSFPEHNFNNIISIQNTSAPTGFTSGANFFVVQTQLPIMSFITNGSIIRFSQTQTSANVNLNTGHRIISVIDSDEFVIGTTTGSSLSSPITSGIIGFNQEFKLYNIKDVGGVVGDNFNNKTFAVREIVDENNFKFYTNDFFASTTESGGGNSAYISSLIHGFNGIQTNTKDNILNRSINLQGENYSFLCCPQLSTMMNTGNVKDVFARVILDQSPGSMVFSYLSNPKIFDKVPLDKLDELEFSMLNYNGTLYEFNDLDYSFTLQITENIDVTDSFNVSSKRGIIDN